MAPVVLPKVSLHVTCMKDLNQVSNMSRSAVYKAQSGGGGEVLGENAGSVPK